MGHNYTLLLHQRSLEENIRCFNISIAAWIFKSSFMSSMIHLKTNSACQRKGDREAKGRHWLCPGARAKSVAAVNYCPLPFFCWIIQKLATVPAPPPVSNGISHSAQCWPSPSQRAPAGHTSHYQRLSARNNTFKPFQLSGHGWRRRLWGGEAGARRGYRILHWWNGDKIVTWICNGDILSRSPAHSCTQTGYPTSYVWCHWGGHW